MLSLGIDVSKHKSTVSLTNEYGEILLGPKDLNNTKEDLESLVKDLKKFGKEEIRVVMEYTNVFHKPVLNFLNSKGYFCSVVNPLKMKKYLNNLSFRGVKTDRKDSLSISQYGIDNWFRLERYEDSQDEIYESMRRLSREYLTKQKIRTSQKQDLDHIIDQVMPGIKDIFAGYNPHPESDRLCDFMETFWHYDLISRYSYKTFEKKYRKWCSKKGYRFMTKQPARVYSLAINSIPTVPKDEITKSLVMMAITSLRKTDSDLNQILTQLRVLAEKLPEYRIIKEMPCTGNKLGPLLLAELGDVRRFHSADALIAYAGIDVPPNESGEYTAKNRHITRKGSSPLRKLLYQLTTALNISRPKEDSAVVDFILKKKSEGKPHKVALIAGANKFLRIYYARVKELYR